MEILHKEQSPENKKIYYWAITVFYKKLDKELLFLIAQNSQTGNISFVSGAQEDEDQTLIKTAQRENIEELGLYPEKYKLKQINVKHDFVFGPKKKERAGHKGQYQVFVSDLSNLNQEITHTKELKSIKWLNKKEVILSLTFPDLKELFKKTVEAIES